MLDPNAFCGTVIDNRYRMHKFLGNGAFGFVFASEELALGEVVGRAAVKLIRPQSDTHRLSILNEIRAMSGLSHPHLLGYRSSGEFTLPSGEKLIFLALELAEDALDIALSRGPLALTEITDMSHDIAEALVYLQEIGVVHRDLKPANILRVGRSWKVADFGISRFTAHTLHQTAAAGTLTYMSPEAIDGEVGAPGDVWALGVLLQECLTGRFPYPDASQLSFIRSVAHNEPFIVPAMPEPFDEIVRGCLTKDAKSRWTAKQVLEALELQARPSSTGNPVPVAPRPPVVTPAAVPISQTIVLPRQTQEPVVDAGGNGTYHTINEALSAVPQAARVWIRPGIYRESVLLDRGITLVGEGMREQIIIECGTGNCVKVVAATSSVRGVTLKGVAKSMNKKYHTISVSGGDLTLEDCIVLSDSLSCVAVQGQQSSILLRRCLITEGNSDGVLFSGGAQGIIEACHISKHARHGLHIKEGATPTTRDCRLTANRGSGIYIDDGRGTVQSCEIRLNHKTGVHIAADGESDIFDCNITDNKQQAISVERGARATVERCDLRGNVFGAWAVASGSSVRQRNNKEG